MFRASVFRVSAFRVSVFRVSAFRGSVSSVRASEKNENPRATERPNVTLGPQFYELLTSRETFSSTNSWIVIKVLRDRVPLYIDRNEAMGIIAVLFPSEMQPRGALRFLTDE